MNNTYHTDIMQGSDEWHEIRRGILPAPDTKNVLNPTLKTSNNDKTRQLTWELAAQRISGYVEPQYIGDDMLRGYADEILAREKYSETRAPVEEVGFVTSDALGGEFPDQLPRLVVVRRLQCRGQDVLDLGGCQNAHAGC